MSVFSNNRTVEQLKAETRSSKIFFNYATKNGQPLMHQNSNVQMVACSNEAGQTVAWCSKEIAEEISKGINPKSNPRGLAVIDVTVEETGETFTKLVHPSAGAQRIDGMDL